MATPTSNESLLASARFDEIEAVDCTDQYRVTAEAYNDGMRRYEDEVRAAMGDVEYEERMIRREATVRALDEGLLRRSLFVGRRPWPRGRIARRDEH